MNPTSDPNVFIEEQGGDYLIYNSEPLGRWIMRGSCNQCGLCEVGQANPRPLIWMDEPGTPGACIDPNFENRLDFPILPEGPPDWPGCTLSGEWLR